MIHTNTRSKVLSSGVIGRWRSQSIKLGLAWLVLILVTLSLLAACAQPEQAKPINLRVAHWQPAGGATDVNIFKRFCDEVTEKIKGRLVAQDLAGGQLGKPGAAHYDLIVSGVGDVTMFLPVYFAGTYPIATNIASFPWKISIMHGYLCCYVGLVEKGLSDQALDKETHLLYLGTVGPYTLFTKKKVEKLEDLKGLKIRAPGGIMNQTLESFGCVPVNVAGGETLPALQTGVIDGALVASVTAMEYGMPEVIKYIIQVPGNFGTSASGAVMNWNKFNSLPKDLQKIVNEAGEKMLGWQAGHFESEGKTADNAFKSAGAQSITLSSAELQRWQDATKALETGWFAEMEKQGLGSQAKKALSEYQKAVEQYSK